MKFYIYIVECCDGTYYVGSTNNLEKRLREHNFQKKGARYTRMRRPVKMIYSEEFETLHEARVREIYIKTWSRKRKERLVKGIGQNQRSKTSNKVKSQNSKLKI